MSPLTTKTNEPPSFWTTACFGTSTRPTDWFGWYLFAGVEGRVVARNIFLDGNTFEDSHSVDKYPLVADLQAGIAFTLGENTRIAYTHLLRSREFREQDGTTQFGTLSVSVRF